MPHICVVRIKDLLNSINLFLLIYEYLPDSTTQGAWGHSNKCSNVLVPFRLNTRIWAGEAIHSNLGTAHRLWKLLLTPVLLSKKESTQGMQTQIWHLYQSHRIPIHFLPSTFLCRDSNTWDWSERMRQRPPTVPHKSNELLHCLIQGNSMVHHRPEVPVFERAHETNCDGRAFCWHEN